MISQSSKDFLIESSIVIVGSEIISRIWKIISILDNVKLNPFDFWILMHLWFVTEYETDTKFYSQNPFIPENLVKNTPFPSSQYR